MSMYQQQPAQMYSYKQIEQVYILQESVTGKKGEKQMCKNNEFASSAMFYEKVLSAVLQTTQDTYFTT